MPTNRLIHEKSPYLLQHAHNPVDWHAWGAEAFEKARREDKPIFLSVGYSTCHWCHVMERESFENVEIARLLNEFFVPVKVDREERPDVDRVYMTFVQATTGSGGWPMSAWLTPSLEPFAGGTYFPPEDRYGRPGFVTVLRRLADIWRNERNRVTDQAARIAAMLRDYAAPRAGSAVDLDAAQHANAQAAESFDEEWGGFGRAPKFPRPAMLEFLLATSRRDPAGAGGQQARQIAFHTLRMMAAGGIHDQLGGGFHRYSVDRFWHVPHYEKMLYDQAQLASVYLQAWQINGDPSFVDVIQDILHYVLRDMTSQDGPFFSAEDADSLGHEAGEKREGAFYIWRKQEIDNALGTQAEAFNHAYGVEPQGNSPEGSDPHGELHGYNTLIRRLENPAQYEALAAARHTLFDLRAKRPRPHLDDKIVTSWNGLMISAFARASMALANPAWLDAARMAAEFIRAKMFDGKRLLRSYREGPGSEGFADDYAAMTGAAIDLYEATGGIAWLQWAVELQSILDAEFFDPDSGGYFGAKAGDKSILVRMKEDHDGAEPAASSLAARNALRLARMLDDANLEARALKTIHAFGEQLHAMPSSMPAMLSALLLSKAPPRQIVIAGLRADPATEALATVAREMAAPEAALLYADGAEGHRWLARRLDFIRTSTPIDGKPAAYVCENFTCRLPITDPQQLRQELR